MADLNLTLVNYSKPLTLLGWDRPMQSSAINASFRWSYLHILDYFCVKSYIYLFIYFNFWEYMHPAINKSNQ